MRQGSGHQEDIVPLSAIAARFVQDMGVLLVTFNYRLILHQSQGPIKQAHDGKRRKTICSQFFYQNVNAHKNCFEIG